MIYSKELEKYFNKKYPSNNKYKIKIIEIGYPDRLIMPEPEDLNIEGFFNLKEFKILIYTDNLKRIKFSLNSTWKLEKIIIVGNYLNSNNICEIFEEFNFPKLKSILITNCNLKTFPTSDNNFEFLSFLNLENNNLLNLSFIKNLFNLKILYLNSNEIKEIGLKNYEIKRLKLEEVYLGNNFLDNSEAYLLLDNLKKLRVISLQNNCLKGDLVIKSLSLNLTDFFINENLIEKIFIGNLEDLKNIKEFWLSDNLISDSSFIKLLNCEIKSLAISNNRLVINLKDLSRFFNLSYLTMGTDDRNKIKDGIKNDIIGDITDLNLNKIKWLCIENINIKGSLICLKNSPLKNMKFKIDDFKEVTPFWTTNTHFQNLLKIYEFNLNLYFLDFKYQTDNLFSKNALNPSLIRGNVEDIFIETSCQISYERFIVNNEKGNSLFKLKSFSNMSIDDFIVQRKGLWKEILIRNRDIFVINVDEAFDYLKFDIKEINQSYNYWNFSFWWVLSLFLVISLTFITIFGGSLDGESDDKD